MAGLGKSYDYDSLGRLAQVKQPVDEDPANNIVTRFGYDEAGNKVLQTDGNNHTTYFGYDKLGRSVWRRMPNGQTEKMEYDALGQLRKKTDFRKKDGLPGYVTEYSYDERGRLKSKTPDARLNEAALTYTYPSEFVSTATRGSGDSALTTISYFDRERGRLVKVETPTGTLEYSYDDAGNKKSVKNTANGGTNESTYGYDELGRLTTVRDAGDLLATYNYDALGNRESINRANGVSTTYRYDEQNRLRNITHRKGTNVLSSFTYNVRNDGKRTGVKESLLNADEVNGAPRTTNRAVAYDFDLSGRLKSDNRIAESTRLYSWTYDNANNRRTQSIPNYTGLGTAATNIGSTATAYSYNVADELYEETSTSTVVYEYDFNCNQISKTAGSNTTNYGYSFQDKLLSVTNASIQYALLCILVYSTAIRQLQCRCLN